MQPNKKTMAELVQDVFVEEEITEPVNDSFVSDDDKDQLGKILEKASDKQAEQILMKVDPRNQVKYFEEQYIRWARNPAKRNDRATWSSKLSFQLGSLLIASPESMGMPDYIYYLPKDRFVCFPEHYSGP